MSLSSTDKGVANIDRQDLLNNMLVLAKAAKIFRVPVILTAVESEEGEASMNTRPSMDMFHTCSRRPGSETVMGIGMALLEHTHYDPQNGAPINSNLADYMVAVNADVPPIDVHFLDFPDKELNELGARGIGEIGLAGIAAAITAAVHHATGVRVRELPVKIEHLLTSSVLA